MKTQEEADGVGRVMYRNGVLEYGMYRNMMEYGIGGGHFWGQLRT